MDEKEFEEKVRALTFWSGKNYMTLDDMATVQPGLARLMPEVGARAWKLFYAAKAGNWPMAEFQHKEIRGLMELGAFMRPKHEEALNKFLEEDWKPLEAAIEKQDIAAFEKLFANAIDMANAYHELKDKPYIRWKLPDTPPPDLDLAPRGSAKK
jgi:hypothetical protein